MCLTRLTLARRRKEVGVIRISTNQVGALFLFVL